MSASISGFPQDFRALSSMTAEESYNKAKMQLRELAEGLLNKKARVEQGHRDEEKKAWKRQLKDTGRQHIWIFEYIWRFLSHLKNSLVDWTWCVPIFLHTFSVFPGGSVPSCRITIRCSGSLCGINCDGVVFLVPYFALARKCEAILKELLVNPVILLLNARLKKRLFAP